MAKTLKIEDVPDDIHQALAEQAAQEGLSVSAYVLRELQQVTKATDPDELLARLQSLPRVELGDLSAADVIREAREERTNQIIDAVNRR